MLLNLQVFMATFIYFLYRKCVLVSTEKHVKQEKKKCYFSICQIEFLEMLSFLKAELWAQT